MYSIQVNVEVLPLSPIIFVSAVDVLACKVNVIEVPAVQVLGKLKIIVGFLYPEPAYAIR